MIDKTTPTVTEIEIAVAKYFNPRQNLVVPNVFWGMFQHECDLTVMTMSGYLYEIEIKVSRSDLIKDKEKKHGHCSDLIKKLYFAIPEKLLKDIDHIPERAGVLIVKRKSSKHQWMVYKEREAVEGNYRKISAEERYQIARLGALRVFGLKEKIVKLIKEKNELSRGLNA